MVEGVAHEGLRPLVLQEGLRNESEGDALDNNATRCPLSFQGPDMALKIALPRLYRCSDSSFGNVYKLLTQWKRWISTLSLACHLTIHSCRVKIVLSELRTVNIPGYM